MADTKLKQIFTRYLNNMGIDYEDVNDSALDVVISGDNCPAIEVTCSLRMTEHGTIIASFSNWDLTEFGFATDNVYYRCNQANDDSLLARFYVDEDDDLIAHCTFLYYDAINPADIYKLAVAFANDIDDAYKFF